jgi:transaldolase
MKATHLLHSLGQSLWLDHLTPELLDRGLLQQYIQEYCVTGLTSNPTIFNHAIQHSSAYDTRIREKFQEGKSGDDLFFDLAIEDLKRAAAMFAPIHNQTNGVDGWVSLEVSPTLAHDTAGSLAAAKTLYARAAIPNLFIKIPGTKEGLPAIEEAIFAGIPINVTLLFSREQYTAAAEAFHRGIERRIEAGLKPDIASVASLFVSRWDAAVMNIVPAKLRGRLGIAIAKRTYKAYRTMLSSPRWQRVYNAGGRPQRLLWASTEGSNGLRRSLHQGARGAIHREHDARKNFKSPCESHSIGLHSPGRWRRLRSGPGAVCHKRHRCRRNAKPASGGWRYYFYPIVE